MNFQLTPEQQLAVDSTAPLILLSAVPGAGKTSTLITRAQRLIEEGIDPHRIALLTYTVKAAQNMRDRLKCWICGGTGGDPGWGCEACDGTGIAKCWVGTLHSFCLMILKQDHALVGYGPEIQVVTDEEREEILQELIAEHRYKGSRSALDLVLKQEPNSNSCRTSACTVAKAYWHKLKEMGAMDFDLILQMGLIAVQQLETSAAQFEVLMVDEIQDVTVRDMQIYNALPIPNKMLVGDISQSIFGFRGSDPRAVLDWGLHPDVTKLSLTGNHRCSKEVVRVANLLIASPMTSTRAEQGQVLVTRCEDEAEELEYIYHFIQTNTECTQDFDSFTVLLRYNALVDQYSAGLHALGVPVASAPSLPPDWGLCQRLVSFMARPDDDRLALSYIAAKDGPEVAQSAKELAVNELTSVSNAYLQLAHPFETMEIFKVLAECHISEESLSAVRMMIEQLGSACTFSDLLLAMHEVQYSAPMGAGVRVQTYHSAKGSQAKTVLLPAFEQSIFPGRNQADFEEIKRVAYVGVTRAEDSLVFSYCRTRKNSYTGAVEEQSPSEFLRLMQLI